MAYYSGLRRAHVAEDVGDHHQKVKTVGNLLRAYPDRHFTTYSNRLEEKNIDASRVTHRKSGRSATTALKCVRLSCTRVDGLTLLLHLRSGNGGVYSG